MVADGSPLPVWAESPKVVPVSGKVVDHGNGTPVRRDFWLLSRIVMLLAGPVPVMVMTTCGDGGGDGGAAVVVVVGGNVGAVVGGGGDAVGWEGSVDVCAPESLVFCVEPAVVEVADL
jgi:hypothetical protein